MKYEESYKLREYELDDFDRIKPAYLSYFTQETAERCITEEKLSSRMMHKVEHRAYIISRLRIEVYTGAPMYSTLRLRTWVSEGHGAIYPRHYDFIGENDEYIAKGSADWAVISTDDKRLVRFGDYDMGKVSVDEPQELSMAYKFRIPEAADMSIVDCIRVGYSQTDLNKHMNNVAYINPMYDNIPEVEGRTLSSMNIHFKHESLQGEKLNILVSREYTRDKDVEEVNKLDPRADSVFFVRLIGDETVRAEAAWGFINN